MLWLKKVKGSRRSLWKIISSTRSNTIKKMEVFARKSRFKIIFSCDTQFLHYYLQSFFNVHSTAVVFHSYLCYFNEIKFCFSRINVE